MSIPYNAHHSTMSMENIHRIVIEALKKVDPGRKCFRMIGGVLVERTVKDVLLALQHNTEQVCVSLTI